MLVGLLDKYAFWIIFLKYKYSCYRYIQNILILSIKVIKWYLSIFWLITWFNDNATKWQWYRVSIVRKKQGFHCRIRQINPAFYTCLSFMNLNDNYMACEIWLFVIHVIMNWKCKHCKILCIIKNLFYCHKLMHCTVVIYILLWDILFCATIYWSVPWVLSFLIFSQFYYTLQF